MADIKTKNIKDKTIKVLDRTNIISQRMKTAYVKGKTKGKEAVSQDNDSISEYVDNQVAGTARTAADISVAGAEAIGRKSFEETRRNRQKYNGIKKAVKGDAADARRNAGGYKNSCKEEYKRNIRKRYGSAGEGKAPEQGKITMNVSKGRKLEGNVYYKKQMKRLELNSAKSKVKVTGIRKIAIVINKSIRAIAAGGKALISAILALGWIAIVIIVVFCLFGAALYFFGDASSRNYTPPSAEVEAYDDVITKYAREYGIPDYVELIKAVMMQESGGEGKDPMQASECSYNTKYPRTPGGIKDERYSIQCGVQMLASLLKKAGCENPVDMTKIRLALQGYNYGPGYIDWAIKRDGGYTVENAAVFSDKKAEENGWESYGDKQYASHVLRYYPFGNYNYGVGNGVIVKVAQEQVGNKGGKKYWSWYGFDSRVEWCACYVSWCADQCGYIEGGIIPKFAAVTEGVRWFKEKGQWQKRGYKPEAGDIIFFDNNGDGTPDHVGIVEKYDSNLVYTFEGNARDECKAIRYYYRNKVIYGYGVPKY